jgi:hypothetical protein
MALETRLTDSNVKSQEMCEWHDNPEELVSTHNPWTTWLDPPILSPDSSTS